MSKLTFLIKGSRGRNLELSDEINQYRDKEIITEVYLTDPSKETQIPMILSVGLVKDLRNYLNRLIRKHKRLFRKALKLLQDNDLTYKYVYNKHPITGYYVTKELNQTHQVLTDSEVIALAVKLGYLNDLK